jgi:hypothetical protein
MHIVPNGEVLQRPSICFLCETSPTREAGTKVADLERDYTPPAPSNLYGRKYVCERCADELARLFGYVQSEDVQNANAALASARQTLQEVADYARSLSAAIVDRFGAVESAISVQTVTQGVQPVAGRNRS